MPRKLIGHKTSVIVPFSTYEQLEKFAVDENRSISQMAAMLIAEAIDSRNKQKK